MYYLDRNNNNKVVYILDNSNGIHIHINYFKQQEGILSTTLLLSRRWV